MADREEVLKGLEHHRHLEASRNELGHDECFDCPYRPYGEDTCASLDRMIDDALELLEYQELKPPKILPDHRFGCPTCGVEIIQIGNYCFCCGQKLDWEALQKR